MKRYCIIICGFLLIIIFSCGENQNLPSENTNGLSAYGEENSLEIATWNIEWFPKDGQSTINKVREIIKTLDIDIFAIQEIADTLAFRQLVNSLSNYDGLYSADTYKDDYQKTGIIYRNDIIQIGEVTQIFWYDYNFPRPPLVIEITAQNHQNIFDFYLIVIHLKAFDHPNDRERRKAAAGSLKTYLDSAIANSDEKDYIIAGDWNDEIDDPPDENCFTVFLDDDNYIFLTEPLAGNPSYASYPYSSSLIDHILITKYAEEEYGNGEIKTIRLDDYIKNYDDIISDHRPVAAKFRAF